MRARTTRPGRAARAERVAPNGRDFFPWYNTEHHHIGLGLFTPHDVDYGLAAAKREQRARVLAEAFALHPERFPNAQPSPRPLPTAVWINPPNAPAVAEEGRTP